MWIDNFCDGVCCNMSKLTNIMIIVEGFPPFTSKHDVQCFKRFATILVSLLSLRLI